MGIKNEFETARFERRISGQEDDALWAAKWMAERCAKVVDSPDFYVGPREKRARQILDLAQELSR